MKGSLSKKLSPKIIIKYRTLKYQEIDTIRKNSLQVYNTPIQGLTTEDILTTTKNAVIIIEIEKIKEEYFLANWDKRPDILSKLDKFCDHKNFRVAVDVFNFLSMSANLTRGGMTESVAISIYGLLLDFFPYSDEEVNKEKTIELSNQSINIAFSLIYDAAIYLKNYNIIMWGLAILKYIHQKGKRQNIKQLIDSVSETYSEIEQTLQRPERNDLDDSLQLVKEFKANIEERNLSFPALSNNLMKLIYPER